MIKKEGQMTKHMKASILIMVVFGISAAASPAEITKRNGETVKGEIKGLIVQQGLVEKKKGDMYSSTFFTLNGTDIVRIDNDGVHYQPGSDVGFLIMTKKCSAPDLIEALETWIKDPPPQGFPVLWLKRTPSGTKITLGKRGKESVIRNDILGEFRMSKDKGIIVPAIEVVTADGIVKISVQELFDY